MVYIDTSALVAYYCPEPNSDKIEKRMLNFKRLVISNLTEIELFSALSRKIREKRLSISDGNKIVRIFKNHTTDNLFRIIMLEPKHFNLAKNWILQFNSPLRTLDGLHLAIAAEEEIPIFSTDTGLQKASTMLGIEAIGL